jgi:hypothetical protein
MLFDTSGQPRRRRAMIRDAQHVRGSVDFDDTTVESTRNHVIRKRSSTQLRMIERCGTRFASRP